MPRIRQSIDPGNSERLVPGITPRDRRGGVIGPNTRFFGGWRGNFRARGKQTPQRACGARKLYPESKASLFAVKSRVLRRSSGFGDRRAGVGGK